MATEVWISLDDDPDRSSLGAQWLLAGRLDESRETDVWRVVQGYLGYRASSHARSVGFYADVEPDSDGHRALLEARPPGIERLAGSGIRVWVALRWAGPPEQTFFATHRAELAHLARHPPEPHPGLLTKPIPVGVKLTASPDGAFFDVVPTVAG